MGTSIQRKGRDNNGPLYKSAYVYAAILVTAASVVYWGVYSTNVYNNFQNAAYNSGIFGFGAYYVLHYPGLVHGLQLLVFGNHISIDQLVIGVPVFYLAQSALTLSILGVFIVSMTGLAVFFLVRSALGSERLGLFLCILYLVNPAVQSQMLAGFYLESYIPLFCAVALYFYLKGRKAGFLISLFLVAGAIEEGPVIGVALCLGLVAYELMNRSGQEKTRGLTMAYQGIALSVIMIVFYNLVYYGLTDAYLAGAYSGMPAFFTVDPFPAAPFGGHSFEGNPGLGTAINVTTSAHAPLLLAEPYLGFSLVGLLNVPVPFIIFSLPWLYAAVIGGGLFGGQWTGYVLGGSIAATILGLKVFTAKAGHTRRRGATKRMRLLYISAALTLIMWLGALAANYVIYYFPSSSGYSIRLNGADVLSRIESMLLLQQPGGVLNATAQLDSVLAMLPQNASVMTQPEIIPHVIDRQCIDNVFRASEMTFPYGNAVGPPSCVPEYVLIDTNINITTEGGHGSYAALENEIGGALDYMESGNYSVYAQDGGAVLYKCVSGC